MSRRRIDIGIARYLEFRVYGILCMKEEFYRSTPKLLAQQQCAPQQDSLASLLPALNSSCVDLPQACMLRETIHKNVYEPMPTRFNINMAEHPIAALKNGAKASARMSDPPTRAFHTFWFDLCYLFYL